MFEPDRYREDWEDFSHTLKCAAKWNCQRCGKVCRPKGESVKGFANRAFQPGSEVWRDAITNPQKFCLTVAHLDQNTRNDTDENLMALCTKCHLAHDRPHISSNTYDKRGREGQLILELW
jgi:hypothetical protein